MRRRLAATATFSLAFAAFMPVIAHADAPSPSPSLQSTLVPLPDAYGTPVQGHLQGNISVSALAATWGADAARALNELELDGFVAGFALTRTDKATGRLMTEVAVAFTGQHGALRWLASDEAENKADPHFKRTDPAAGLGSHWFGVHLALTNPAADVDGFEFVKGNDVFGVGVYSSPNDFVLPYAQAQARTQYDAAPESTIPPTSWPENQGTASGGEGFSLGDGPWLVLGLAVVALLFGAAAFIWMRRDELRPPKPKVTQKMTDDGQYWWNGRYWIATSEIAPPWAQRSRDGAFWWDGHAWQRVPSPSVPIR